MESQSVRGGDSIGAFSKGEKAALDAAIAVELMLFDQALTASVRDVARSSKVGTRSVCSVSVSSTMRGERS
jgi:hypothetical protein